MDALKREFMDKVHGLPRPLDVKQLMGLVNPEEWNNRVSILDTYNHSMFFRGFIRYFFTLYDGDTAYRMCTIDENYERTVDGTSAGYMGFCCGNIARKEGDGYTAYPTKDGFVREGDVEVVIHARPVKKEEANPHAQVLASQEKEEPVAKKAKPDLSEQYKEKNAALQREVIDWFQPKNGIEMTRVRWIREAIQQLSKVHGSTSDIHRKILTHLREYSNMLRGDRSRDERDDLLVCIMSCTDRLVRSEESLKYRE
jgi:hypothetical protein